MTAPDARQITTCRLCGAEDIRLVVDFGTVALGNNLQETREKARSAEVYPLRLNRCGVCGHFQLSDAVAPDLLYATNYTYLSGIGDSFIKHFDLYAAWVERTCLGLPEKPFIVDIGSNDGTCLKPFKKRGFSVVGVDPASAPARIANENGIETLNAFFNENVVTDILARHGQADMVTSHNVLAHVDDLAATFLAVKALLKDDGYFCFEVGYFPEVLTKNCFDTIYHEHLDYHHAEPLVLHLTSLGFSIELIEVNEIQGGSIRLLFRKDGKGEISEQSAAFLSREKTSVVNDELFLKTWGQSIQHLMAAFKALLLERKGQGKVLAAYGAPTKATLLMKVAGVTSHEISYVIEDNPLKTGRFLPGSGVPILPSSHLTIQEPDVLIIFAWNFSDDIMRKVRGTFSRSVEVIVPLPDLRILEA